MKISKQDATKVGLRIIGYAGDARTNLINAFNMLSKNKIKEADKLYEEALENLVYAHNAQTEMIQKEAAGAKIEYSFIMNHAQDILMTTFILRDLYSAFKAQVKK